MTERRSKRALLAFTLTLCAGMYAVAGYCTLAEQMEVNYNVDHGAIRYQGKQVERGLRP